MTDLRNEKKRSTRAETVWIRPDQLIIEEGDRSRELYVLLAGQLRVESHGRLIASISEYGEVVGELGALTGLPRTASIVSETPSELLKINLENPKILAKHPSVAEKIDAAITRRYHIQQSKIRMYISLTATVRRQLLQETLFETNRPRGANDAFRESEEMKLRVDFRRRIDDLLVYSPDVTDPRTLEKIAADYGVSDIYRDRIAEFPWLDPEIVLKWRRVNEEWSLIEDDPDSGAIIRKAELTIQSSDLLSVYEGMPGIKTEMDIIRIESLLPVQTKIEAVRSVVLKKHGAEPMDERRALYLQRQISLAIAAAKADAGTDVTLIINAARRLDVEHEYEEYVRNMVALSETSTDFVDPVSLF